MIIFLILVFNQVLQTIKFDIEELALVNKYKLHQLKTYNILFMSERPLYITQKIKNYAFNVRYKLLAYFQQYQKNKFLKQGDKIYILGNEFHPDSQNLKQISEQIYNIFIHTPWLTYRSGFPQLPNELEGSYVSDTGWGCMVRVGQMLFAQIIKEFRAQFKGDLDILKLFNDVDKKAPLSIQNISKLALIYYNLKPGQWYNPSQISNILSALYQKHCSSQQSLEFLVFNSGNLFFDQVISRMTLIPNYKKNCACISKDSIICEKCCKLQKSLAIIILSRIGIDSPQPKYLAVLEKMMEFKQFRGVIGGKPKKALYFMGRHNQDYIYLDPHYVQEANKEMTEISDTYICQSFRKCRNTSIDSSLGVSFYLNSLQSLNNFHRSMVKLKQEQPEGLFIFTSDQTPSYIKKQKTEEWKLDQDEDYFEEL